MTEVIIRRNLPRFQNPGFQVARVLNVARQKVEGRLPSLMYDTRVNYLARIEREGFKVNRKKVQRLMRLMGIEAIYPKPNLSLNGKVHPVFLYLLKGLDIKRPNQVWGIDITYIRLEGGFVYLVAVIG